MNKIHETYITSLRTKFEKDSTTGNVKATDNEMVTSVKVRTKDGKTAYNMDKLFPEIAKIAMVKYCK